MRRAALVALVLAVLLTSSVGVVAARGGGGGQCWGTMTTTYASYQIRDDLSHAIRFIASSIGVSPGVIKTSIARTGEFHYDDGTTTVDLTCESSG